MRAPANVLPEGDKRPLSIDLAHHLNYVSKNRTPSPLKHMLKYTFVPGMISLAGGLPHPSLFPFEDVSVTHYTPDANVDAATTSTYSIPKAPTPGTSSFLSKALQYAGSEGTRELVQWLREWTERIIKPGYADYDVLPNFGSTDGWSKVVNLVCEPGDYILVDEHTYPSALNLWAPMNCKGVAVAMDAEGLLPDSLEQILSAWDITHPNENKPKLLYVIPVGQNPTGAVLPAERKRQIYNICVKHDIIICEDDPYYFTTCPKYVPAGQRSNEAAFNATNFISKLEPTFCHFDYQGRVIRLETFSKVLAPGLRLGYFVCNQMFAERLLRATEVVTQAPGGLSQAIVLETLNAWGQSGFLTWLGTISKNYTMRRDWICDALAEHCNVVTAADGIRGIAYPKGHGSDAKPFFSFAYPSAGMFVWLKIDLAGNARYEDICRRGVEDPEREWTEKFWEALTDAKILVTPGFHYIPYEGVGVPLRRQRGVTYLRLSYSYETREAIEIGVSRLVKVFEEWWKL